MKTFKKYKYIIEIERHSLHFDIFFKNINIYVSINLMGFFKLINDIEDTNSEIMFGKFIESNKIKYAF